MTRIDEFICDEHRDELEDRAADLVDRDWLLGQERDDRAASRAEHHAAWVASMTAAAVEWESIKERSGWSSDYGGYWSDWL